MIFLAAEEVVEVEAEGLIEAALLELEVKIVVVPGKGERDDADVKVVGPDVGKEFELVVVVVEIELVEVNP